MKKTLIFFVVLAIGLSSISAVHAVTISTAIPGTTANSTSSSPSAFIANFYQFALLISGILAFGIIVYGGIRYMTSAGNPTAAHDAKDWIEAALLGILLLAGAYFILKIVNPNLINLSLPPLQAVGTSTSGAGTSNTGCGACGGTCNGTCSSGYTCLVSKSAGNSCIPISTCQGVSCGGSSGGAGASGNY